MIDDTWCGRQHSHVHDDDLCSDLQFLKKRLRAFKPFGELILVRIKFICRLIGDPS